MKRFHLQWLLTYKLRSIQPFHVISADILAYDLLPRSHYLAQTPRHPSINLLDHQQISLNESAVLSRPCELLTPSRRLSKASATTTIFQLNLSRGIANVSVRYPHRNEVVRNACWAYELFSRLLSLKCTTQYWANVCLRSCLVLICRERWPLYTIYSTHISNKVSYSCHFQCALVSERLHVLGC